MSLQRRIAVLTVGSLVGMALVIPAATATPTEDTLQRAIKAVTIGQERASAMAAEAPGQENRARGLERAAAALAAAAERKAAKAAAQATDDKPGRGLGRGHAEDVHTILLAGGSPSELPSHGEAVRNLAHAFDVLKADHPGLALGRDKDNGKQGDDD